MTAPRYWTDDEVISNLQTSSRLNKARHQFSGWLGKIEQAGQQRKPLSSIEMRRMEFEAVVDIIAAYTIGEST